MLAVLEELNPAAVWANATVPLAVVSRSGSIESVHRGSIAVATGDGQLIAHAGDPELPVYWRSTAKLHQAIPLVMNGGLDRWQLTQRQLAIICGSHNGEPEQVRIVASILDRIGLRASDLHCGVQEPHGSEAAHELIRRCEAPGPLHNTCSGNHAGLLALSRLLGTSSSNYEAKTHEVQRRALEIVARFAGISVDKIGVGVDGCGIPSYRTPLAAGRHLGTRTSMREARYLRTSQCSAPAR